MNKVAELYGLVEEAGWLEVEVVIPWVCLLAFVQGYHLRHLAQYLPAVVQNAASHPGTGREGGVRQGDGDWRQYVLGTRRTPNSPGWKKGGGRGRLRKRVGEIFIQLTGLLTL